MCQPSLTITALSGTQVTRKIVKNVASKPEIYLQTVLVNQRYTCTFNIAPEATQIMEFRLAVTHALNDFTFGEIVRRGSLNHIIRMPLTLHILV